MTQYSVRSWTLPKRGSGAYPNGYVSTGFDASSFREAAEKFVTMLHQLQGIGSGRRAIVIENTHSGLKKTFRYDGEGLE